MKNLFRIFAFSLFMSVFASCGANEGPVMKTAQLSIEGMSCAHSCAPTIQEKISSVEGVKEAKVSFETKQADVTFDENDHNKHFLLVDDVLTTGATLEACGRALLKIPGAKISIVCMAMSHS